MWFKLLILAIVITVASAVTRSLASHHDQRMPPESTHRRNLQDSTENHHTSNQQQQQHQHQQQQDEEHSDPDYTFSYVVRDDRTGDRKSQHESRLGDRVRGQYRMMESDGTERIVDYSADNWSGFNAIVRHEPEWHRHPAGIRLAEEQQQQQQQQQQQSDNRHGGAATSNSRIAQHSGPQPWAISSSVRHN